MSTKRMQTFISVVFAVICSAALSSAAEQPVRIIMAVPGAEQGLPYQMGQAFAREIANAADGMVEISVQPVGASPITLRGILKGEADIGWIDSRNLGKDIPLLEILACPFLFYEGIQADEFFTNAGGQRIAELAEERGVIIGGWIKAMPWKILAARELSLPENFQGMKIASASFPVLQQSWQALGSLPVILPDGGWAAAARDGSVEAVEGDSVLFAHSDFPESMRLIIETNHYHPYYALCYTNATMAKIPTHLRERVALGMKQGAETAFDVAAQVTYEASMLCDQNGHAIVFTDPIPLAEKVAKETAAFLNAADPKIREALETAKQPIVVM